MARSQIIFDSVSALLPVARGVPGKRTFYIAAGQGNRWVRVWLEKTELQALSATIDQFLAAQQHREPEQSPAGLLGVEPVGTPDADFQAGRLGIAHDQARDMVVLLMQTPEGAPGDEIVVQAWTTKDQARAFSRRAEEVCNAGRPLCPLCGAPIDAEGHMCVRANGHHGART